MLAAAILFAGCGSGNRDSNTDGAGGHNEIAMRIEAPTDFTDPFCTRVQVSGAFTPIVQDQVLPAGTRFIDSVVPNIPEGGGIRVEVGIFANGVCAEPAAGDWYGFADGVSVTTDEVTLVALSLQRQNPAPGTGTIIVRADGRVDSTRFLHGEVVSTDNTPIPNAVCRIFENNRFIGTVISGELAVDLGVINTEVEVSLATTWLRLLCFKPGFANTVKLATLVVDPTNPQFGTFTATVEMRGGVSTEILTSSATELTARLHVPAIALSRVNTEAGDFDKIDNFDDAHALTAGSGNESIPETPVHTMYFAIPNGEELASVEVSADSDGETFIARLFPVQQPYNDRGGFNEGDPIPVQDEPFTFDLEKYLESPVNIGQHQSDGDVSSEAGVTLYQLRLNLVDYDPRREIMTRYPSLKVSMQFTSVQNQTCFKTVQVAEEFAADEVDEMLADEGFQLSREVLNFELFERFTCPVVLEPIFFGARLIIVSAPDLLPASQDLRIHKIARGISTAVVSTAVTGTTVASIRAYLNNAYQNWFIKPKWLLLMGDSELIPTYYDLANFWDTARNAGDLRYGQLNGGGILSAPVLGIGRIPVDNNEQAQAVVDKIKAFENSPPGSFFFDNPYYSRVAFAAEFQDNGSGACCDPLDGRADRWFAETSEKIRNHLVGQGINVERIYVTEPLASQPTTYRDGNPVPLYLRKPTFAWDGDTNDIIDAFNDGRSIVYHRDHGWWNGWSTPAFGSSNLPSVNVSNNEFPVVYSINCASGIFDNETVDLPANVIGGGYGPGVNSVYWGERFLRQSDGAIAIIGDTRSSSTVENNSMAQGLFDATWPGHLPFGGNSVIRKVGDVLNHAKGYISSLGYSNAAKRQENVIYNVLGDPTIEVRTRPPKSIKIQTLFPEVEKLNIGIRCLTCPPVMEPIVVVVQDLKGNEVGRGLANYNGKSFLSEINIGVGELQQPLQVTASGFDVTTDQALYQVR